jgi:uncharacterized membrane protein
MAFCAQCGAEAAGNFCPRCGGAINAPGGAGAGYTATGSAATASTIAAPGMSENVAGALCYLIGLVTGIIFLVLAPYNQNKTVRFHTWQAIFFHIGAIVVWIGFTILNVTLSAMTHGFFGFIALPISLLLSLGFFILWLYLMYSAYNHKMVVLPIVGPLAQKQA